MNKIICHTTHLPVDTIQEISFMELLLDEHWSDGIMELPDNIYTEVGNFNQKLTAKQNYEFLLRAIKKYPFYAVGISEENYAQKQTLHDTVINTNEWDDFRADCYIIGKYQQELLDGGFFDAAVETLLSGIPESVNTEEAVLWLKKMVSHSSEYYRIDDDTCPILIYRGDDSCYNQLNFFANQLAQSLISCRQRVEIFDVQKESHQGLIKNINRRFKAIIGVQTYLFSVTLQDKSINLHDLIIGPKFNIILDHPAWLKDHVLHGPKDYYILTHDRNYVDFANKYYKNIKGCFHFVPGAAYPPHEKNTQKKYGITFIGTYYDYRTIINYIKFQDHKLRTLSLDFLNEMKWHPNEPAEKVFRNVLAHHNMHLNNTDFLELFFSARCACFGIMYYYREKVIQTILDAGISIHVYGNSWDNSPFASHPYLIRHPELMPDESLAVMQQSEISLNVMAWHKEGLTERVLNAMLCKSAVLSDASTALKEYFNDGEDLILFSLEHLDELPSLLQKVINKDNTPTPQLLQIAENGYKKASKKHLWQHRAEYFLSILDILSF